MLFEMMGLIKAGVELKQAEYQMNLEESYRRKSTDELKKIVTEEGGKKRKAALEVLGDRGVKM